MENTIIKVEHVSKEYRLGAIGGTTLRDDLQRLGAKLRKKDDPTRKIGTASATGNQRFLALDDISFEVKKGEALGIIGHNGAGKSTLLKLLSRVTAPTKGTISYNGRVASMLEVGTGFHPELTGRENVYMNGAILGMTKSEIDRKFDQIVEFAEMERFIDTPVKRYSSGMYVKLAFAVAAHLDSEILIMDEVLAVGDTKFQKKCIDKMRSIAAEEDRTVLYVSHNMNTIRQLCNRCIVLDHGHVLLDGPVEEAIGLYVGLNQNLPVSYSYTSKFHQNGKSAGHFMIESLHIHGTDEARFGCGESISLDLLCTSQQQFSDVHFRFEVQYIDGTKIGTSFTNTGTNWKQGDTRTLHLTFSTEHFAPGKYQVDIIAYIYDCTGNEYFLDGVYPGFMLEIDDKLCENNRLVWLHQYWGSIHLHDIAIVKIH